MIIEAVQTVRGVFHNKERVTVYKTLVDESTNKKVVGIVQFLYTKNGTIEQASKGTNINITA